MNLRGAIFSRFKTIGDFAAAIGWSHSKASRIINGIQEPSPSEIEEISKLLELSKESFFKIFFANLYTK
jgi:transcriptional regulator with XRE-family HTH domain